MRSFILAATLAGGAALGGLTFATSASALPMVNPLGADAGKGLATDVAWYCNKKGHCVKAPRRGYIVRFGWEPGCGPGYWNGYRCVAPRVVFKAKPHIKFKPKAHVKIKVK